MPQYVNGAKRRGTNTVQNDELLLSKGDNTAGRLKMARLPDISKPADENSSALTSEISVAEELTKKEKDFDDKFKAKLEEAEIDFKGKLDLGYDESGNIVVKNSDLNDDEKSSIESMFAKGSELAQDYKELTNLRDMVSKIDVASSQESSYFSRENQNESLLSLMSGSKISDAINTASKYASHSTMSTNLAMIR